MENIKPASFESAKCRLNENGEEDFKLNHLVLPLASEFVEYNQLADPLKLDNGSSPSIVPLEIHPEPNSGVLILEHPETGETIRYKQTYNGKSSELKINLHNLPTDSYFAYDTAGQLRVVIESIRKDGLSTAVFVYYQDGWITGAKMIQIPLGGQANPYFSTTKNYDSDLLQKRESKPEQPSQLPVIEYQEIDP